MNVIINGVEYVPKSEIPDLTGARLKECLEILTTMRYLNQCHKMKAYAWEAINALSPELAKLDDEDAFNFIHAK